MPIEPKYSNWMERVVDERRELQEKTDRLGTFLDSDTFTALDYRGQELLIIQHFLMKQYLEILGERIGRFDLSQPPKS